jgi:hypothetical protein
MPLGGKREQRCCGYDGGQAWKYSASTGAGASRRIFQVFALPRNANLFRSRSPSDAYALFILLLNSFERLVLLLLSPVLKTAPGPSRTRNGLGY